MSDGTDCKPLLDHVYAAHRRLDRMIHELENAFGRAPSESRVEDLRQRLLSLRAELAHHMLEEEEGGCLEEAVCRCPSLGPRASELLREHATLLLGIDELLMRLSDCPEPSAPEWAVEFSRLVESLRVHEVAENQLLAQAFGVSWWADDLAT